MPVLLLLLGHLQALIGGARFVGWSRLGVALYANRRRGLVGQFFGRLPVSAYTWGAVITFADAELVERQQLMEHELAHVRQCFALGPLMPLTYALASFVAWARGGDFYRDNYFERAARRAAGQRV